MSKFRLPENPLNLALIVALVVIVASMAAWLLTGAVAFVIIVFVTLVSFKLYIIRSLLRFDRVQKRNK